jgi:hypothetical protein
MQALGEEKISRGHPKFLSRPQLVVKERLSAMTEINVVRYN